MEKTRSAEDGQAGSWNSTRRTEGRKKERSAGQSNCLSSVILRPALRYWKRPAEPVSQCLGAYLPSYLRQVPAVRKDPENANHPPSIKASGPHLSIQSHHYHHRVPPPGLLPPTLSRLLLFLLAQPASAPPPYYFAWVFHYRISESCQYGSRTPKNHCFHQHHCLVGGEERTTYCLIKTLRLHPRSKAESPVQLTS